MRTAGAPYYDVVVRGVTNTLLRDEKTRSNEYMGAAEFGSSTTKPIGSQISDRTLQRRTAAGVQWNALGTVRHRHLSEGTQTTHHHHVQMKTRGTGTGAGTGPVHKQPASSPCANEDPQDRPTHARHPPGTLSVTAPPDHHLSRDSRWSACW